jgi:hypothetical protein
MPEDHITWVEEKGNAACEKIPPRATIHKFVQAGNKISQDVQDNLSKSNLLSPEDTKICVDHFVAKFERRKRNNKKRRKNKQKSVCKSVVPDVYCICRGEEDGLMIQCDGCNEWFHGVCISVTQEEADAMEEYICALCLQDIDEH